MRDVRTRSNARWKKLTSYIRHRWGVNTLSSLLQDVYLRGANLWGVNLRGVNLRGANLGGADLRGTDLWGAYLQGAYLQGANLQGANLRDVNLRDVNLRGVNLRDANLQDVFMNWGSHNLMAERLRQVANGNEVKLEALEFILQGEQRGWCWNEILAQAPDTRLPDGTTLKDWALSEMMTWVQDSDDLPYAFKSYIESKGQTT